MSTSAPSSTPPPPPLTTLSWLDRAMSACLYAMASLFLPKIRSIGISNLPVALRLYFTRNKKRQNDATTTSWKSLLHTCGAYLQMASVPSSIFNIYATTVVKANSTLHVVLIVHDSIEYRLEQQRHMKLQERAQRRRQERMEFWKRILPSAIYQRFAVLVTTVDKEKAKNSDDNNNNKTNPVTAVHLQKHVHKAKGIVQGHRQSVADDVAWGAWQVALLYYDMNQALAVGWMVLLLQILEHAILEPKLTQRQKCFKTTWILLVAVVSGKLFF